MEAISVAVRRGGSVESRHRVHAVAVRDGDVIAAAGDPWLVTVFRSSAKPLQALPLVRVRADLSFEVIDREKDMIRLGAGGLDGSTLTTGVVGAAMQTLSKFRRLAESHSVDEIIGAATSAVRIA